MAYYHHINRISGCCITRNDPKDLLPYLWPERIYSYFIVKCDEKGDRIYPWTTGDINTVAQELLEF